jgi:hypothetical protein
MDVVRNNIELIGGAVDLKSTSPAGTSHQDSSDARLRHRRRRQLFQQGREGLGDQHRYPREGDILQP